MNYRTIGALALVVVLTVTVLMGWGATRLRFDYDFENFFPLGDPDLEHYGEFRRLFENDNDYLLIGIENVEGIFQPGFLQKVNQLSRDLKGLPEVETVLSITEARRPVKTPTGWVRIPLVHINDPASLTRDSTRIVTDPFLSGNLVARNGLAVAIVVKHQPNLEKPKADPFLAQINQLVSQNQFEKVHIAGKIKAQGIYIDKMKEELIIFMSSSLLLVAIFLFIGYRSIWGILMPISIVFLSIIWILGMMGLAGKRLDLLMILLPPIMFVVGMSDIVHLLSKYIEELRLGRDKNQALKTAIKEVGFATFLTSLTTAIGFVTLLTASISPIREFGVFTALGVFLALIITYSVLPPILMFRSPPRVALRYTNRKFWNHLLGKGFFLVLNHPRLVLVGSVLIAVLSAWGISRIDINSYLIDDIPVNDPLKQDFAFFDQNFNGSRPFELSLELVGEGSGFTDPVVMGEVEKIENFLNANRMGQGIISPNHLVKTINQGLNGGLASEFRIPIETADLEQLQRWKKMVLNQGIRSSIIDSSGMMGRISGRMTDIGSSESLKQAEGLNDFLKDHIDNNVLIPRYTGTSLLIDKNNLYLSSNLILGLALAFAAVALISGLLYRSVKMTIITLVPNILPLVMVAGIMGFLGIDLKLSTSIIFTIAFGIAVDDTIHFLSKLNLELRRGRTLLYAVKRTYFSTGKAITVTSAILIGGFLILILSGFGGTFYTGLLVSLTLVLALVVDLTLLPVLIIFFFRPRSQTRGLEAGKNE